MEKKTNKLLINVMKNAFFGDYKTNRIIPILLLVNASVFVFVNLSQHLFGFYPEKLLGFPADPGKFIFRFWSVFTYMYTHENLSHLINNLIWLYFMGQAFQVVIGGHRLFSVYVFGGFCGALAYLLSGTVLEGFHGSILIGASAAVMAIAVAIGFYSPNMPVNVIFIGEVRIKWVVIACFLLSTVIDASENTGGKISHIGGAIFGMIYAIQLKNGREIGFGFFDISKWKKRNVKLVHKSEKNKGLGNLTQIEKQKILNEILDKINKSGYDSLSGKDKEILHELSKN